MDEQGFRSFLKKQRRSDETIDQCVRLTREFEAYLVEQRGTKGLDEANTEDLEAFVSWNRKQRWAVNSYLWASHRYYEYTSNDQMRRHAAHTRQQEIAAGRRRRESLQLKEIQGVAAENLGKLAAIGIVRVEELLNAGRTIRKREQLSRRSRVPPEDILELVKLADLTRIVDIKGLRVRLLYEAGMDTTERVSNCDPGELRERLVHVNERRKILKRHPTPVEAEYWVTQARALQKVVQY